MINQPPINPTISYPTWPIDLVHMRFNGIFSSAHFFLAKWMAWIQHDLKRTAQSCDLLNVLATYKMLTLKMLILHQLGAVSRRRTGFEIVSSACNLPIHLFTQLCLSVNYVLTDSWLQWLISSTKHLANGNWRLYSLQGYWWLINTFRYLSC